MTDPPRRLGRGLEALIGGAGHETRTPSTELPKDIPIELIRPNPFQPRREFRAQDMDELQASMKASGLLQPIVIRTADNGFELVAGERRLRAATAIGWTSIPAVVRSFDDRDMLTMALIENLQRSDLNPIEEAEGYHRLQDEFRLTQQEIANTVGKERSTIANLLRLRSLPEAVREMVRQGRLSVGHARALLALPGGTDLTAVAERVARDSLTVRDVERLSRSAHVDRPPRSEAQAREPVSSTETAETRTIADKLRRFLQTDVAITADRRAQGDIHIHFYSADDLDRLLLKILGPDWQQH
ncbi:MAG: Stage 0 sporulation protein J [Gemmatimonadaceae bacterium]|nr:Stage 0 sporulation protein J [Gemmatimonadaceae bacterium]